MGWQKRGWRRRSDLEPGQSMMRVELAIEVLEAERKEIVAAIPEPYAGEGRGGAESMRLLGQSVSGLCRTNALLEARVAELEGAAVVGIPVGATRGRVPKDGKRYRVWSLSMVLWWDRERGGFKGGLRDLDDSGTVNGWLLEPVKDPR